MRVPQALDRVRQVAERDKEVKFTALLHHVSVESLREAYWGVRPQAAPGVDGTTWKGYGQNLEANLLDPVGRPCLPQTGFDHQSSSAIDRLPGCSGGTSVPFQRAGNPNLIDTNGDGLGMALIMTRRAGDMGISAG